MPISVTDPAAGERAQSHATTEAEFGRISQMTARLTVHYSLALPPAEEAALLRPRGHCTSVLCRQLARCKSAWIRIRFGAELRRNPTPTKCICGNNCFSSKFSQNLCHRVTFTAKPSSTHILPPPTRPPRETSRSLGMRLTAAVATLSAMPTHSVSPSLSCPSVRPSVRTSEK